MCEGMCEKCKARLEKKHALESKIKNLIEELHSELSMPEFLEKREEVMSLLDELKEVTE